MMLHRKRSDRNRSYNFPQKEPITSKSPIIKTGRGFNNKDNSLDTLKINHILYFTPCMSQNIIEYFELNFGLSHTNYYKLERLSNFGYFPFLKKLKQVFRHSSHITK